MKILIVKTSSLGDIIQTFPALDYLRQKFPDGQIDWVVESPFAELLKNHPQVDRVITFESKIWRRSPFKKENMRGVKNFIKSLRKFKYDFLFDFQGNLKSGFITAVARSAHKAGYGLKSVSEWPNTLFTNFKMNPEKGVNVRDEYLQLARSFFKESKNYLYTPVLLRLEPIQQQKLISLFSNQVAPTLVCPSSAWPNKCLDADLLIKFLKELNRPPYWFIWATPKERELALRLASHFSSSAVLERLSLPLLQHVMSKCQLIVSMDSLPLHLCATTSTPSISFFGPSSAKKYAPLGEHHRSVQGSCPFKVEFERRCPKLRSCQTGSCLKIAQNLDWIETR